MKKPLSNCCYYSYKKDIHSEGYICNWCGKQCELTTRRDRLWNEIEALLCDWNKPSKLENTALDPNVAKVYRFVKKKVNEATGK